MADKGVQYTLTLTEEQKNLMKSLGIVGVAPCQGMTAEEVVGQLQLHASVVSHKSLDI